MRTRSESGLLPLLLKRIQACRKLREPPVGLGFRVYIEYLIP